MLEASCSAADAIYHSSLMPGAAPPYLGRGGVLRLLFRRTPGREDDLAPGLLHGGNRCLGGAGDRNRNRRANLSFGQQADAVAEPPQQPRRDERRAVECAIGSQFTTIERRLQTPEIHNLEILPENLVVEAALRQPAMQRRLAALKAVQRHAGARRLALAAARRSLALARADAAPDPFGAVMRPGIVPDLVELHPLNQSLAPILTHPA